MPRSLKELEKSIFGKDMTDKEWLELNKEVDEAWKSATDEERQEFEDSGAGDMLGQIIEFMD
ncbi:MAG TPA: hypothetical protein H9723_10755 [Candidatus Mediterraneibacter stercoravium]|mgnify:CR=1 FL=1|uniref:Uncharacterized protein n=1 Tax=Candidatus Mediterraneibacter stercoravium TaxID=2838685 RepID=A0A9D2K2W5_9FIRM|nr:hypothetical protein [Candidatus Mediterraneibacter stercoravium]